MFFATERGGIALTMSIRSISLEASDISSMRNGAVKVLVFVFVVLTALRLGKLQARRRATIGTEAAHEKRAQRHRQLSCHGRATVKHPRNP
jgi:hypothetical protein